MAIEVTCSACRRSMMLKDSCAGKTGACPHCKAPLTVPQAEPFPQGRPPSEPSRIVTDFVPPTDRQIAFATKLGIAIPEGISRQQLSNLIEEAKENSPATESQKEFLRDLGVSCPAGIRANQMTLLLDAATNIRDQVTQGVYDQLKASGQFLEHASDEEILEELRNRSKLFFVFLMDDDEFRYHEGTPIRGQLRWCDSLNEADVKYILASLAAQWARTLDMSAYSDEFDGSPPSVKFATGEIKNKGPVVRLNVSPFGPDSA